MNTNIANYFIKLWKSKNFNTGEYVAIDTFYRAGVLHANVEYNPNGVIALKDNSNATTGEHIAIDAIQNAESWQANVINESNAIAIVKGNLPTTDEQTIEYISYLKNIGINKIAIINASENDCAAIGCLKNVDDAFKIDNLCEVSAVRFGNTLTYKGVLFSI